MNEKHDIWLLFAATQKDASGPSRQFAALRILVAIGAIADSGQPNALKIYGFTA